MTMVWTWVGVWRWQMKVRCWMYFNSRANGIFWHIRCGVWKTWISKIQRHEMSAIVSGITFNPNNDRWKKEIISCISLLKTRKPSQVCNRILFRFHLCHITMPKPVTGKKINTTLDQLVTVVSDSLQSPRL